MKNTIKSIILTTVLSLGLVQAASAEASSCTSNDCKHMAEAVYHEARGEGRQGMIAVASVIKNRTTERNMSAARVVQQRGQFSYRTKRNLGFSDKKSYEAARSIAYGVMNNTIRDNTGGATYFRSGGGSWGKNFRQTARIGSHVFFKPRR